MVYVLAMILPPFVLLLNGQILASIINLAMVVPAVYFGLTTSFPALFLIPGLHACFALFFRRRQRQVEAEFDQARQKFSPAVFRRYLERRRARKVRNPTDGAPG
jgi:hypothetical protein